MSRPFPGGIRPLSLSLALFLLCSFAGAQSWTYPGCPVVTDSDFTLTTLMKRGTAPDSTLSEPLKMALSLNSEGTVDIYYVERGGAAAAGRLKRYHPGNPAKVKTLLVLPTVRKPFASAHATDEGLTGIALDPDFRTNHFIYLHWSPADAAEFRISRFTLTGDTILSGTEKILLRIPSQRDDCCHSGGGMAFDAYGDLWIAQGNNEGRGSNTAPTQGIDETNRSNSCAWGSCSTHGLRGGILRIHPDNSARGYAIPAGNFGEYFAGKTGKAEYLDTAQVLPEIYVKGTRNAYTLQVDPVRRWVFWGEVGTDISVALRGDTAKVRDEQNLRKTPAYMGWPFFIENNVPYSHPAGAVIDSNAPAVNSKWNTGLKTLPPATSPFLPVADNTTITGPFYRYDGALQSNVKMPPHFQRHLFYGDFKTSLLFLASLDENGDKVIDVKPIFRNFTFRNPIDIQAGPDGALYIINYGGYYSSSANTGIVKIAYSGSCRPATPLLEKPPSTYLNPGARYAPRSDGWFVNLASAAPVLVPEGMAGFQIFDLAGKKVWERKHLRAGSSFQLPRLKPGARKYRWVPALGGAPGRAFRDVR